MSVVKYALFLGVLCKMAENDSKMDKPNVLVFGGKTVSLKNIFISKCYV